ncbi:major pollen allergen Ole e 6-like [Benincasa hispida]|uniref:major pollen allergen Ole e 6-like n=1 Tax=Benincasa hispida TaxID=102211 RepID=UPI0019013BC1|nr:major pollen allergen Ole e 6-like [Benincasa hispida]XP_038906512.1 major pollen allergen Ole e 6-like [Benincasa hispida]
MAKKMIAVFFMCIVVMAALQFATANEEVDKYEAKFDAKYKSCYETCEKECLENGSGQTFCEVKCDEDCDEKEKADKLHIELH